MLFLRFPHLSRSASGFSNRIRSETNHSGRFTLMVAGIFPDSR